MKKKIISLFLATVILLSAITVTCYATDSGRAYVFTYSSIDSDFPVGINSPILSNWWYLDYDAGEYIDNHAPTVYSVLQSSKISVIAATGAESAIACFSDPNEVYLITACRDNPWYSITEPNDRAVIDLPQISSKYNRLTVCLSPKSAVTPDPIPDSTQLTGYVYPSNLLNQLYFRSTKCAVGWTSGDLKYSSYKEWMETFTEYTISYSVNDSIVYANNEIRDTMGATYANPLDSYFVRGDGAQYLGVAD